MFSLPLRAIGALAVGMTLALGHPALAANSSTDHAHDHTHNDDAKRIYKGYFEDHEIQPRTLADWQGDWQSVYPLLMDGTLAPVMADKAAHGDKTAETYTAYYETGYKTEVNRIVIDGDTFTFHSGDQSVTAIYETDGHEVLTYSKGNRGVRYIFEKASGDAEAPKYVQFSDHAVFPTKVGHYHLYWGEDRAEILKELTNWPTYYPSALTGQQIVDEMLAH